MSNVHCTNENVYIFLFINIFLFFSSFLRFLFFLHIYLMLIAVYPFLDISVHFHSKKKHFFFVVRYVYLVFFCRPVTTITLQLAKFFYLLLLGSSIASIIEFFPLFCRLKRLIGSQTYNSTIKE